MNADIKKSQKSQETHKQILKWANRLKRLITKEDAHLTKKYTKIFPT